MSKILKIGIVGCGAIGSSLAKTIARDFKQDARLVALFDIDLKKSRGLSKRVCGACDLAVLDLKKLITKSKLVIEASSAAASWKIARNVLIRGRDIMIMSVGGIVNRFSQLSALAKRHNAKVYIPSGAISGVDALKAARMGKLYKVILKTSKHPQSFQGVDYIKRKGIRLDRLKRETLLFSGRAKHAMRFFPQNTNIAGTLSLAGLGRQNTRVEIVASPKQKKNIHELRIYSHAARIFTRTENLAHPDNPKTSFLAVLSAVATLKQILEPVKIGT